MAKRLFLSAIVLLILVIGLIPLLSMLLDSLFLDGTFSLDAYRKLFETSQPMILMLHSITLSTLVTLLTLLVGVPLGIVLGKTDLPLRRTFTVLFTIPLLLPSIIIAISWYDLLGRGGLLSRIIDPSFTELTSQLLFALPGTTLVLFTLFLPIPVLFTMLFLRTIDPRLEESGRMVSGWQGVLRGITLPLIKPGILLSAIIVFLLTFGEFSVPNFLRYDLFPVESFTQFSALYDFRAATAAATPLILVVLILLFLEARILQEGTYQLRPSPLYATLPPIALGRYRFWILGAVTTASLLLVILPIVVLFIQSLGADAYVEAIQRAGDSLARSFQYAIVGATLLIFMGFFTGYLIQKRALSLWRSVDTLTFFLFALPGTVIGIGLIHFWNRPATNYIYAAPLILFIAYLAKYLVITSRITVAQLAQIPSSMEEAAKMAGAGWFRSIFLITMPLARRGLAIGWLTAYLFVLRDTDTVMLLYPPGHDTLPVRILTLMANGSPELIAAMSVIMIMAILVPIAIAWCTLRLIHPQKGKR